MPDGRAGRSGSWRRAPDVTVYTQDDPRSPAIRRAIHDADLAVSWHHDIETVPTLIRVDGGIEVERTVGWSPRRSGRRSPGVDRPRRRTCPRCDPAAAR